MTPHIPEEFSTRLIDWSPFVIMGNTMPPRDPDEDEEDDSEIVGAFGGRKCSEDFADCDADGFGRARGGLAQSCECFRSWHETDMPPQSPRVSY